MNKKEMMFRFINTIKNKGLLTSFIAYLFDYNNFNDYNYIFRLSSDQFNVIMDIYDNISNNRFNRYVFCFLDGEYDYKTKEENSVFITKIFINNISDDDIKLHKLAYLFKIDINDMIVYAKSFLEDKYVKILIDIINKPI